MCLESYSWAWYSLYLFYTKDFISTPPAFRFTNSHTCSSIHPPLPHPPASPWASSASSTCFSPRPTPPRDTHNWHTLTHSLISPLSSHTSSWCRDLRLRLLAVQNRIGMAPKREPSVKKSPSPVSQPRLGPPFPCLPAAPAAPKPAPEQKPRMLRPSDSPFDPSTLEVSRETAVYFLLQS